MVDLKNCRIFAIGLSYIDMTHFQSNSKIYNVLRSVGVATPDTVFNVHGTKNAERCFFYSLNFQNIMVKNIEKTETAVLPANEQATELLDLLKQTIELQHNFLKHRERLIKIEEMEDSVQVAEETMCQTHEALANVVRDYFDYELTRTISKK